MKTAFFLKTHVEKVGIHVGATYLVNKIDVKQGKTLDLTIKKLKLIVNFKNEKIKN